MFLSPLKTGSLLATKARELSRQESALPDRRFTFPAWLSFFLVACQGLTFLRDLPVPLGQSAI